MWMKGAFPEVQASIGEARQHAPNHFVFQHRGAQRAAGLLRLLHLSDTSSFLAARCPRQATNAHNLSFAQVQQGNGQIRFHC
jgi:hypothetical protein